MDICICTCRGLYMCFILYCNGLLSNIYIVHNFFKLEILPYTEILYNIVFRNKYSFKPYIHFTSIKKSSIILYIVAQRAMYVIFSLILSLHVHIQISISNVYLLVLILQIFINFSKYVKVQILTGPEIFKYHIF
jgi:hypothetical protein